MNLEKMEQKFNEKNFRVLQNATLRMGISDAVINNEVFAETIHVFSENIETGKVSNQKSSGRCWIFAALNTLRHKMNKEYNLENFELSQTYTFFWDKLEKSNFFLDAIIKTHKEDIDSRIVHHLLSIPQQDGGQWDMVVSLIQKYGVVPKSVMPEVYHSSNSAMLNTLLNKKLRLNAEILRNSDLDEKGLYDLKETMMEEIYAFLCVMLGVPPKTFNFEYYDKDKKFHRDLNINPQDFYNKYINMDLNEYVSIINAPTKDKPFYEMFTVEYLGNVIGGKPVRYLNLPMDEFKKLAIRQISDGETVWFGCDVGQNSQRTLGIMDLNLFEFEKSFGIKFEQSKAETLDYCESLMTHAMVLSGVNIIDGKSTRWKVENSWGEANGEKGYFVMSDEWMDKYTYQIVVNKKYLSQELQAKLNNDPIVLRPWDPMGSLALCK
ncbi:aminopeptidase C [Streptobacillus moniliformis]|uniref:aminopeptidase C n=1 Tax=Streptobacillus moniliformis TaxID=34105 RepID=UPI0009C16F4F|nr:C1 family peptidase [Streptobacillus moniliformis]